MSARPTDEDQEFESPVIEEAEEVTSIENEEAILAVAMENQAPV